MYDVFGGKDGSPTPMIPSMIRVEDKQNTRHARTSYMAAVGQLEDFQI